MRLSFVLTIVACLAGAVSVSAQDQPFIRADCNGDGAVDIGDAIFSLDVLFTMGGPEGCTDACDSNDDGNLDIADAIFDLQFLFDSGPPPLAPFPTCGPDPTADSQGCATYTGCPIVLPPAAPVLDPHASATSDASVNLTGTAPAGTTVEVVAPSGVQLVPVVGGVFDADVPLVPNTINHLFFTAIDALDQRSAPTPTNVTQDSTPPELFIDAPTEGEELLLVDEVTVVGRVNDLLSGFAGLTVTVNGMPATISMGGGAFATYQASGIVLNVGSSTLITAVATDALGNSDSVEVSVTRTEPMVGEPFIEIVSGDQQSGEVLTELPTPLVVMVTDGDGSPFENKIVEFRVTRSDGTVAEVSGGSGAIVSYVMTDAAGLAQVFWTLGTHSGSGNNRVRATSAGVTGAVTFFASGEAGPASQINIGDGNGQRVEAGTAAPLPLDVFVHDGQNGAAGVMVTFTVTQGGGLVDGLPETTVMTGADGHASVVMTMGPGGGNHRVQATFPGNPDLPVTFTLVGIVRDLSQPTRLDALVLNNASQPIGGVTCTLTVGDTTLPSVVSAADGTVSIEAGDVGGSAHLTVDGSTATTVNGMAVPAGSFPNLAYSIVLVPNANNTLPMPVLLPRLDPVNVYAYSSTEDVEMAVVGLEGISLLVTAGSMTIGGLPAPDGTPISVDQVQTDSVPMPPPNGARPSVVFTMQPSNGHFDPPVRLIYPNVQGLAPGTVVQVTSFDHDTERFEIVGSGQVTDDGARIISDEGSGLPKGGWHYFSGRNGPVGQILGNIQAELDETCSASVNTDVSVMEPDGSFEILTLISDTTNGDLLQVLIVCDDGTEVLYGLSEWFTLIQGQTYRIDPVVLSSTPPPLPEFITLSVPSVSLVSVGDTQQLTTTSHLLDGGTLDVTLAVDGTQYTSSNSSIATVSADGLVTATGAGQFFITATNSGSAAVIGMFAVPGELTTGIGLVREADGTPVVGADVTLTSGIGSVGDLTEAGGVFSIAGIPVSGGAITATAFADLGGVPHVSPPVTQSPVAGGLTDFGILTLIEALTDVIGIVHDPNGMPFENADVTVSVGGFSQTVSSGVDGSFTVLDVPTHLGPISVDVFADTGTETFFAGTSVVPITGGLTDVGVLLLGALIPGFSTTDASGPTGSQVVVTARFGNAFGDVQGWVFGLCHDLGDLTLIDAVDGASIPTLKNGNPPDFVSTTIVFDGWNHGLVIDFFDTVQLPVGEQVSVVDATYQITSAGGTVTDLVYCQNGSPPVQIAYVVGGAAIPAPTSPGSVTNTSP